MARVLIRNVSGDAVESYRQKAKIKGIPLEQELRNLLESNTPFTPEECVRVSREPRSRYGEIRPSLALDKICEGLL